MKDKIYTKVAGISFEGRQRTVEVLEENEELILKREKDNKFDKNAIQIFNKTGIMISYINKVLAGDMAKLMDSGVDFNCRVMQITGFTQATQGVNLEITRQPINCKDADEKYHIKQAEVI